MGNVNWDLAGFTDEQSRLGKKVGGGPIFVPARIDLDLSTDELVWSLRGPRRPEITEPDPRILDHFVHLWRAKPEAILRFSRSWGVLGLDRHDRQLAALLQIFRNGRVDDNQQSVIMDARSGIGLDPLQVRREPLALWRYFSQRANVALNIAAALNQKRVGTEEDWGCLAKLCQHSGDFGANLPTRFGPGFMESFIKPGTWKPNVENQRIFIATEANLWLRLGRVGFSVWPADGSGSGLGIVVDYDFCLLGAIAFQLALTMSAAESFFTCSGCGVPYLRRKKRPKPGESNFCESCDKSGVALRNADRARRERMQQARQLRADGLTISEIAKKVGARSLSTVRRWIEKGK